MSWRRCLFLNLAVLCGMLLPHPQANAETLSREQITDLFSQAKQYFRQATDLIAMDPEQAKALYLKAALRFERIAQEGNIQNGKLYYNMGNTYFRMGDIGRAILHYRRAQRLIPNDANLQQNLRYARSKRIDQIEEPQQTKVWKTLLFWHYDFSTKTRLILFTFCFTAFCLIASLRLFIKKFGISALITLSTLSSVIFLGSLAMEALSQSEITGGVILADEVIARKGNSETYQPSFEAPLHTGTEFEMIEKREDWFHVSLSDGRKCWLPQHSVGLI